jgi:hypothetical protein
MTDTACVARWASNAHGHRQGALCGDPVFKRLADVDLCDHHYWRALDAAVAVRRREQQREESEFYGSRTWEASAAEVVYYVQRSDGLIKIGTSAVFRARLSALRAEHGSVQILLTHRGGLDREHEMHRKFAKLRVGNRELFRPGKPLMTWIISVRRRQHADTLLPGTLPLSDLVALADPKKAK